MAKSLKQIQSEIKGIDLIIQVLDARAIQSSTNQELVNLAKDRILVNVALKSDLADLTDKKSNVYYFDVKQKNLSTEINKILIDLAETDEQDLDMKSNTIDNIHNYLFSKSKLKLLNSDLTFLQHFLID